MAAGEQQGDVAGRDSAFARLAMLRRLVRTALVVDKLGWLVAGAVAACLAVGAIDFGLRLPAWVRIAALAAGVGVVVWYWVTRIRPAAKFRPRLEELALRVERSAAGESAKGVLASGVGLIDAAGGEGVVARAQAALERVAVTKVVNWRRPAMAALVAGVAGFAVAGLLAYAPGMTLVGARRVLTPWTGVEWPKRTGVRDITDVAVHPLGSALPLRAALVKGDPAARVTVQYRVNDGPVLELALSAQGREVTLAPEMGSEEGPVKGALLETLLEPGAMAAGRDGGDGTLEYWFASSDDRTDPAKVRLVPPPAVLGAEVKVTPPEYARRKDARTLEAGPGTDQRATVAGVLPGSRIEMTVRMNKPVRGIRGDKAAWARQALGEQGAALLSEPDTTVSVEPTTWRLAWTQRQTVRLTPHPVDEDGVEPAAESVYRVEVREDRPAEAVVVQPPQDLEVLASAKVPVSGEVRDDVGVLWAAMEFAVASPKAGSASSEVEPSPDRVELARVEGKDEAGLSLTVGGEIDLATLGLSAGQELWLTAAGTDTYAVDGKTHNTARSAVRRVRIISSERMIEQVWNELGSLRRSAVKATEQQDALTEKTKKGTEGTARQQAEITDSTARMSRAAAELARRVRENGLQDQDLEGVLSQAKTLTEQAKESSAQAGEAARKADEAKAAGNDAARKEAQKQAADAQDRTARTLEQLAETLDRGQDAWSTTRAVQRLIEDQQALRNQTGDLGEKTVGKNEEELTPAEKQKIAELSEKQDQLAKRTDEQLKKLQERAQQMKATDPAGAQAMQDAAQKGQRSGASEQMQKAAEQIRKNQQQGAGQQQQQAQKSLEQVMEQLKQNARSRDATLRRQMASLIETLNRLITMQDREVARVAAANAAGAETGAFKGLDDPMVKLHTQTLAAVSQAREAGKEARRAATLIGEAAEAQQGAVVALRASPVEGAEAEAKERESLEKLTAARDEAQKQQDDAAQRDADRQRAELKQKYQAMLAEQGAVRTEGADLVGKELDRRARARARGLAEREDGIADGAATLMKETAELKDSELFVLAHDRLDTLVRAAAEGLRGDAVGDAVTSKQRSAERVLRQLIEALEENKEEEEGFREPESGGGGQQQSGAGDKPPLVPPAAEVKLLKLMQQEALSLTREAEESRSSESAAEAVRLQKALAERGALLLKKMQNPPGGGQ